MIRGQERDGWSGGDVWVGWGGGVNRWGSAANKFLSNGVISTFSFTQKGEDLSPGLKVHWLTSLVLQPQAFLFQPMSHHAASFIFFSFIIFTREVQCWCPRGDRRVLRTVGCEIPGLTTVEKHDMEGEDVDFFSSQIEKKKNVYVKTRIMQ